MKRVLQFFFVAVVVILSSCSSKNLMKYYYPINQKVEVKIYKYINPEKKESTEYWKVTTNPNQGIVLTESFDSKFNLYNTFEEKVNRNKAELLRYIDYRDGGELNFKEVKAKIEKSQVYKSSKSESYSYAVTYTNDYGRFTFEKKRRFVNFEEIEIGGKRYETAKFEDNYSIINVFDEKDKYEFSQVTFYSFEIGMVKYERLISPTGEMKILELDKILTEDEFKEMLIANN